MRGDFSAGFHEAETVIWSIGTGTRVVAAFTLWH